MLLREQSDGSVMAIGQASHAWISGQLAAAWEGPVPTEVRLAAEQHDIGWMEWDRAPRLNPSTGLPYSFMELPRDQHVAIWSGAGARLLSQSAYAALLVSMHGTGLYERFPPRDLGPEEQDAVDRFLAGERAFQDRLRRELDVDAERLAAESALVFAWDWLSLGLCLDWAPRRIEGYELEADTIRPWPFREPSVELWCEGRRLAGRFADQDALDRAFAQATPASIRFRLTAP